VSHRQGEQNGLPEASRNSAYPARSTSPDAEIFIPREPAGFSDDEVALILRALQLDTP
jgi:hypothetical protein